MLPSGEVENFMPDTRKALINLLGMRLILLAAICTVLCGCVASFTSGFGHVKALFMGDSITFYWRDHVNFSQRNWVASGVPGQTCGQIQSRLSGELASNSPKILHILCGTNDIWWSSNPKGAEQQIATMVQQGNADGVRVILATIPPVRFDKTITLPATFNTQVTTLNAWIRSFATTNQVQLVDYEAIMRDSSGQIDAGYTDDGVHPNAAGYQVMTSAITPVLATIDASQ
jgi:lysophospholipase L1-like esterase